MTSVVGGPDFLAGVRSKKSTLAIGAFLMIATTAVDIGKAVLFFPVLERHGKRTAVAYLATMIFEMAMMTVGVLAPHQRHRRAAALPITRRRGLPRST